MINTDYFILESIEGVCGDCLNKYTAHNKMQCKIKDREVDFNGCCFYYSSPRTNEGNGKFEIDYSKLK